MNKINTIKRKLKGITITVLQLIVYLLSFLFIRAAVRAKFILPNNINTLIRGSLIVSNHRSKMDPFVVLAYLPLITFVQIIPIRFPVDYDYMKYRRFSYTLPFIGGYNIGGSPWAKMVGLLRTKKYLEQNTTVFLFPEGKINQDMIGEFQRGINFFLEGGRKVIIIRIDGLGRIGGGLFKKGNSLRFSKVFDTSSEKIDAIKLRTLLNEL